VGLMLPGFKNRDEPRDGFGWAYNLAGTLDGLTLLDETVGTEKHNTDLAGLEVHAHTLNAGGEPEDGLVFRY
jgi:hypothetical protein